MRIIAILALLLELATLIITLKEKANDSNINHKTVKNKAYDLWLKFKNLTS